MTSLKSAVNLLGLSKQDNTNSTYAAEGEKNVIWLA